ncbi:uncharacterized protein [Oscarella lobularis]|uniref:uncharacterized protein n=1 Tax=Oscarella lobularis TaxID=121494 RepID=UPI0033140D45
MENDFRRAVQLLQIARQCRPRSPDDAVPILHQCLLILDRLVAFIPRAHRMQLEAFAELAANHRALGNWEEVIGATSAVLVRPLQFINDVQLFCLSCRRDAFERLRQYKDALNDCNLLINVCPPGERREYERKINKLKLNIEMDDCADNRLPEAAREAGQEKRSKKEKVVEFPQVTQKKKSAKEMRKDEFRRKKEMEEIGRQLQQRTVSKEASPQVELRFLSLPLSMQVTHRLLPRLLLLQRRMKSALSLQTKRKAKRERTRLLTTFYHRLPLPFPVKTSRNLILKIKLRRRGRKVERGKRWKT